MNRLRRRLLAGGLGLMAASVASAESGTAPALSARRQRVVIVGGGWGGLSTARSLNRRAAEQGVALDIRLIDPSRQFLIHPFINRALIGQHPAPALWETRALPEAQRVEAWVTGIDRAQREVATSAGKLGYDWLVLAPGVSEDWLSLVEPAGGAKHAEASPDADFCRQNWSSAWAENDRLAALQARLADFKAGHLVMTVPLAPYRCLPAPYERALMLAGWFAREQRDVHLTVVDPNAPWPALTRAVRQEFSGRLSYLPQSRVHRVAVAARQVVLDVEEISFDTALLMPRQRAGLPCQMAGVIGVDAWAEVDPLRFCAQADDRIYVVGDSVGKVSPLFGHYPKTAQVAVAMGQVVARDILARVAGGSPTDGAAAGAPLAGSTCFTQTTFMPPEMVEITARFARRGDGLLTQRIEQKRIPQPDGELEAWLAALSAAVGIEKYSDGDAKR